MNYPFSLGDTVRVIDPEETPSEWAIFLVSSVKNHRFCLSPLDHQHLYEPLWVHPYEITLVDS